MKVSTVGNALDMVSQNGQVIILPVRETLKVLCALALAA